MQILIWIWLGISGGCTKKKSSGLSLKLGGVQPLGLSFSWQWNLPKSTAPRKTSSGSKQGKSRESSAVPCDLKSLPFQTGGGPAALWPPQNTRSPPGTAQEWGPQRLPSWRCNPKSCLASSARGVGPRQTGTWRWIKEARHGRNTFLSTVP